MTEPTVETAISNARSTMDALEDWTGIEVTFNHTTAFTVRAHIRSTEETNMVDIVDVHNVLEKNGFSEVENASVSESSWSYEWDESNY